MGRKLILDTGVLIAVEHGKLTLDSFEYEDDLAIAAVSVAELLVGVELADDRNRMERQRFADYALSLIPVVDYTTDIARVHARLMAHVKRTGNGRGSNDLIIAATAAETGRALITTDKSARFDELPEVESELLTA